ncbi:MAG TPA: hypothetical protein VGM50_09925 [Gemmatimonadaceae bacterium]
MIERGRAKRTTTLPSIDVVLDTARRFTEAAKESHAKVICSHRDSWIHMCCAPERDSARYESNDRQPECNANENYWVTRRSLKKERLKHSAKCDCNSNPDCGANGRNTQFAQRYQRNDLSRSRAQRNAHADFVIEPADVVTHRTVEPDAGQQHRQNSDGGQKRGTYSYWPNFRL